MQIKVNYPNYFFQEERIHMKVFLIMVQSINGKIRMSGNEQRSWSSKEDMENFQKITQDIGIVIMGRKTFQEIGKPLKDRINIVLTGTPEKFNEYEQKYRKEIYFTDKPPEILLRNLEENGFNEVALIGGPTINSLFLEKDLIDEIFLTIEPVIIEGDLSVFKYVNIKYEFSLKDFKKLNENTMLLHYVKKNNEIKKEGSK